jgi:hypothetical protein
MRTRLILAVLLTLITTPLFAASIDIGFNDDSFQLGADWTLSATPYGDTIGNARYLYSDDEGTRLASAGIDFIGTPGNFPGLSTGLGVKTYHGQADSDIEFTNIGIGLRVGYTSPQLRGLGADASIYYAPRIFSFRDAERMLDSQIRLTYPIIPKAKVFIGYQHIKLDLDNGANDETIDKSLRVGFVATF